jgi:AcrR family transcriptional regulator
MVRVTPKTRADTRARLLEAAAEAFARSGLDAANINDISQAAGFSKGTVYGYFESKEALFLAVVEEACVRTVAQAPQMDGAASTAERLRVLLASDVEWARQHPALEQVLVRELFVANPERYERVVAAAGPYVERVAETLRYGAERGEVRRDIPAEQLALIFTGLGMLALVENWGSGGVWPAFDAIAPLIVELFLNGARPQAAEPAMTRAEVQEIRKEARP